MGGEAAVEGLRRSETAPAAPILHSWALFSIGPCRAKNVVMSRQPRSIAPALAISALLLGMGQLVTPQNPQPAPDNTATNKRDRAPSQRTADQAKETLSDRQIMQEQESDHGRQIALDLRSQRQGHRRAWQSHAQGTRP